MSLWFVQSMFLFWLVSPLLYIMLIRYSTDNHLFHLIQAIYWLQLLLPVVIFIALENHHMHVFKAFSLSMYSPYMHFLPYLLVGFSAGVIQIRSCNDSSWYADLWHHFPYQALFGYHQKAISKAEESADACNRLFSITMSVLLFGIAVGLLVKQSVYGQPMVVWAASIVVLSLNLKHVYNHHHHHRHRLRDHHFHYDMIM